jgi:excisionase family DNA binding protein
MPLIPLAPAVWPRAFLLILHTINFRANTQETSPDTVFALGRSRVRNRAEPLGTVRSGNRKQKKLMGNEKPLTRRLLKVKDAATYLALSPWKVRKLIEEGELPYLQDSAGGPFLIDVRDLDGYIERNKKKREA